MSYYRGNLDADLAELGSSPECGTAAVLDQIAKKIGYGRAQQILQIMWARSLRDAKIPTSGALLPEPLSAAPVPAVSSAADMSRESGQAGVEVNRAAVRALDMLSTAALDHYTPHMICVPTEKWVEAMAVAGDEMNATVQAPVSGVPDGVTPCACHPGEFCKQIAAPVPAAVPDGVLSALESCIERLEAEGYACKSERDILWAAQAPRLNNEGDEIGTNGGDALTRAADAVRKFGQVATNVLELHAAQEKEVKS